MDTVETLRLLIVPGVSPGRWVSIWRERFAAPIEVLVVPAVDVGQLLLDGEGHAAFLRLPVTDDLAVIPLWVEQSVVLVSQENELSLLAEASPADLVDETIITAADDVLAWADAPGTPFAGVAPADAGAAVELVAAEAGVAVVPASIARAHARKDVRVIPLEGGPASQVGLAWLPRDGVAPPLVDDLIAVVRGRTANSSRGRPADGDGGAERPTARAKAKAKAARIAESKGAAARGGKGRGGAASPRSRATPRRRSGR